MQSFNVPIVCTLYRHFSSTHKTTSLQRTTGFNATNAGEEDD